MQKYYVGNIHWDTVEDDLREVLAPLGEVSFVRIIRNIATQKSLGYGFVGMLGESPITTQVLRAGGRTLVVRPYVERAEREAAAEAAAGLSNAEAA